MKKTIIIMIMLCIFSVGAYAVLATEPLTNFDLGNNQGHIDLATRHVTMNLKKGWNLLPLKFMYEASGRYWSNKKENTCEQDVFQSIYVYSPVKKQYTKLPVIDDWGAPKSRNNQYLLEEFAGKYYHIFAGSGWIYTPKDCILEGDDGATLIAGSYGSEGQDNSYTYDELVMKAGWNYIPVDYYWSLASRTFADVFDSCGVQKYYLWDNQNQSWIAASQQGFAWNEKVSPLMTFTTILVKTSKDCKVAKNVKDGPSSLPPQIPI
jgi:hypothetical protein